MNSRVGGTDTDWTNDVLASQASLDGPEIRFANEPAERFQYRLRIYGHINAGPEGFSTQPMTSIAAGQRYSYTALAESALEVPLTYSLMSGPEAMSIDSASGQLQWSTQADDVGAHQNHHSC